jgi:ATP-dependent HslUV protease subunit HslV
MDNKTLEFRSTTVLGLFRNGEAALGADGQVTLGAAVMKQSSKKVRRIYNNSVLVGFAGGAADAITLLERFEDKLNQYHGNVQRASVELAKEWRTDKMLRQLEALLAVISKDCALVISGTGEVIEPDDGIVAIGSGGNYALAAARMLLKHSKLSAKEVVHEALDTAADICIYTNHNITIETL